MAALVFMSLFLPETWPFPLALLPADAYLVGGSVRDRLLNRRAAYLDLDFVLPRQAVEVAAAIARACDAGFVVLDRARQIARVAFDRVTVDFAQQQGDTLAADLRRRDFTVNAIAYSPHRQTLIDPLGGEADIASKTIRMVSAANLAADPLRLMRAYRQAAQLGFTLAPGTQAAIGALASKLQSVSVERVSSELDALLSVPAGTEQLEPILQNQLLSFCLPHFTAERIARVSAIDGAIAQFERALPAYAETLRQWQKPVPAGFYRSWIKAAKLSRLMSTEAPTAAAELMALKYSRAEAQAVLAPIELQPDIDAMQAGPLSRAQQFFFFKAAGANFPAVSLVALSQGVELSVLAPAIARFLNPEDEIAHAPVLLAGDVLMKQLGMKPGPEVGALLKAVELAQAKGEIDSREAALAWVRQLAT